MKTSINNPTQKIMSLLLLLSLFITIDIQAQVEINEQGNVGIKTAPFEDANNGYFPELSLFGRLDIRYPQPFFTNIVIGSSSGGAITSGNANLLFGQDVGRNITSGNSNVCFGGISGVNLTDAEYNFFLGTFTGNNFNSNQNVAIGFGSGSSTNANAPLCTGTGNVLLGSETARFIQGGSNRNVAIGFNTMYELSTGVQNVAIGADALRSVQSGNRNVGIGMQAGENTIGGENIFIGYRAGRNTTSGNNVFLGALAGQDATGANNLFLGRRAGQEATGSSNIFIGTSAGRFETGNSRLYIDNTATTNPLIYGEFDGIGLVCINGNFHVTGSLTAPVKNFKIDHPLDPKNKDLVFASIEAPEMINMFRGNIKTDQEGYATVILPDYFSAANVDFSYHLTCIGVFAQAIVQQKINGNAFVIQTDKPNVEVSWQVLAKRSDQWAKENPLKVEQNKKK